MATFTTRLGLRKPATTDLVNVTTDLDNNLDAIDAAVGSSIVTSTTRPSSPWAGQQIFETDTHNELVYSGGWYHESIPVVSATTAILNPYNYQLIYNAMDGLLYRYNSATSQWFKATAYARYSASTTQTISGGDNLVQFGSAVATDPRVTASGTGNTSFTVTPGRWKISASLRLSNTGLTTGIFLITGTTATETTAFATNNTTFLNVGVSDTIEFTASTAVSVVVWNSGGASSQILATGNGGCNVSFERSL